MPLKKQAPRKNSEAFPEKRRAAEKAPEPAKFEIL
jgi:hypothetical protein